ncbi:MAG: hypothetical protein ACOYT4_04320 [Nanoarchaeota archaeon]
MAPNIWIYLLIAIVFLSALFAILLSRRKAVNYYVLFFVGIIWTISGIILVNYVLIILGTIFIIIGLIHTSRWKQNNRELRRISKNKKILMLGSCIVIILGTIFYYLIHHKILKI